MRLSAAADGSTSDIIQHQGSQLDAVVETAAEEQAWTLQDFLQEAEADAAQPQQGELATSDAETNSSSSKFKNSHARRQQQFADRKRKEWQDQQAAKHAATRREAMQSQRQQQQADGNSVDSSSSSSGGPPRMPYAYDMSRWQVRGRDWRQGVPNK
jgi:type II secretory pathway pseudopilin PulG